MERRPRRLIKKFVDPQYAIRLIINVQESPQKVTKRKFRPLALITYLISKISFPRHDHISMLVSNFTNIIMTIVSHYGANEISKCFYVTQLSAVYRNVVDRLPEKYQANHKQCCEKARVPTGSSMCRRSFGRIVTQKKGKVMVL